MSKIYMVITEKDWEKATPEQQSWMTFNTMQKMDARLKKLERRPIMDKVLAFGGGVIGGALAAIGFNMK